VASLIRQDQIDILVDLAGHTARNRLPVFARRPAPVQAAWLGYPNTTGLESMDCRITDAVCDPPGLTEAWHSEALVRLPGPFLCYRPAADCPSEGPLPALEAGHVTFGCCNNLAKVNGRVIEVWAGILRNLPGARLLLASRGLADPGTAARVRGDFSALGVQPGRIDCDGAGLPLSGHLRRYRGIDIALDPFPYNGATTTCEALWMGVPVVTLAGNAHVSRVGASLLGHLGATDWVASDPAGYGAICARLAGDPAGLAAIRAGLRRRMAGSPLCDGPLFAGRLEAAWRELWSRRCKKNSPLVPPASVPQGGTSADGIGANQNNRATG